MFLLKSKSSSPRGNICGFSQRLYINKIICGGFINIREGITIMKCTKRHQEQQQMKLESISEILAQINTTFKADSKSSCAYVRSKQNFRAKVGSLEDNAGHTGIFNG